MICSPYREHWTCPVESGTPVLRGNEKVGGWKIGSRGKQTLSADRETSDAEGQGESCRQPELTLSLGAAARNHLFLVTHGSFFGAWSQ